MAKSDPRATNPRTVDLNAYNPIELKRLQTVLNELHLAQYPRTQGSMGTVRGIQSSTDRAMPGSATFSTRKLLQRVLGQIDKIAKDAHRELLASDSRKEARDEAKGTAAPVPAVERNTKLEQAKRWASHYWAAEKTALRYGRDQLAQQYARYAADWDTKARVLEDQIT